MAHINAFQRRGEDISGVAARKMPSAAGACRLTFCPQVRDAARMNPNELNSPARSWLAAIKAQNASGCGGSAQAAPVKGQISLTPAIASDIV